MAPSFVTQLPIVSSADLKYGKNCSICHEIYGTITDKDAVRLPCGHEFGYNCLETWLSPEGGKNSCPLCRRPLFPVVPEIEEGNVLRRNDTGEDGHWNNVAIDLDSELSANGIVHRTQPFRDWLLYSQLDAQGARLPPVSCPF